VDGLPLSADRRLVAVANDLEMICGQLTDVDRGDSLSAEPLKISVDSNIVLTSRPRMGYELAGAKLAKTRVG
jgi:hypothetical protein